jgi:osmotically-inducible protein OsmY
MNVAGNLYKHFTIILILTLLGGCTAVVVGGAATGVALVHDRRSAGTVIDDEAIELKALAKMLQNDSLRQQTHINITSYNYLVLITGEAPSLKLKNLTESTIRTIPKVREVYNEINIAAPSAFLARSSDALITSKVKTGLLKYSGMPDFDPTRVKIVTENGTVFLMGLLTHKESDTVAEYARTVGGVEKVVKIIEYIDKK